MFPFPPYRLRHAAPLSFPIDAVYTWVDGSDPEWLQQRQRLLKQTDAKTPPLREALAPARFQDNDELRFSLRSLEEFAPWIRQIHLVTAGHLPAWLDERTVKIVPHQTIFPPEAALPVFSNRPIELCVHRSPDLAEHFLYLNDDFIFGSPVFPKDFFLQNGQPLLWAVQRGKNTMRRLLDQPLTGSSHNTAVALSHHLILNKFQKTFPLTMRHYPKAMTRSSVQALWETFPEAVGKTLNSPFRSNSDISITMLYPLYMLCLGKGMLRPINGFSQVFDCLTRRVAHMGASLGDANFSRKLRRIRFFKPLTFCLNDAPGSTNTDKTALRSFLESLFPTPSRFER